MELLEKHIKGMSLLPIPSRWMETKTSHKETGGTEWDAWDYGMRFLLPLPDFRRTWRRGIGYGLALTIELSIWAKSPGQ